MKFTVVTISLNQAEFLERAILSVLGQLDADVEHIIVDPGSTDGSREIIERYRQHFAHVILEKDSGPADGLNRGFSRASGDIYCYLNADDTFEPGAMSTVAAFLRDHPRLDVVCGHGWVTDRFDRRLRRIWSEPFSRWRAAYGASVQIQPSTFIRRGAFLKAGGFNPNNCVSWDGELLVELFLTGARIGLIDAFLSTYRLHGASITNSGRLMAAAQQANAIRFQRLMGRPWVARDNLKGTAFRILKHLTSPRATIERIRKGPVFNRRVE